MHSLCHCAEFLATENTEHIKLAIWSTIVAFLLLLEAAFFTLNWIFIAWQRLPGGGRRPGGRRFVSFNGGI